MSKAERTTQFIIEKVAPIFNKNGYSGTSLSDVTKATGLTKGAVYGNFVSKEELALKAFNHNVKRVFTQLNAYMDREATVIGKLKALTAFYRTYPVLTADLGGCPLLNVGVDANHQNELLHNRVKDVNGKLQRNMSKLLQVGKKTGEIRNEIDTEKYAGLIISMIEGSIYMTFILNDDQYLMNMMEQIEKVIDHQLKA